MGECRDWTADYAGTGQRNHLQVRHQHRPTNRTYGWNCLQVRHQRRQGHVLDFNEGDCNALLEWARPYELKMIVDDGGTTVTELSIDSLTAGSAVV